MSPNLTMGELLIMANLRGVALLRGWNLTKTITKAKCAVAVLEHLAATIEKRPPADPAPNASATDNTVLEFERLLRDLQQSDEPGKPDAD